MKSPSVFLLILSMLFLVLPIIQQMIKVKQESKLALVTDVILEMDESSLEFGEPDAEDLDAYMNSKIELFLYANKNVNDSNKAVITPFTQKIKSPPPQLLGLS